MKHTATEAEKKAVLDAVFEPLKSEPPVRSSKLVLRPADATHDALRKCLRWLDACRELGWAESVMPHIESLFWRYHDSAGNKKPQNIDTRPLSHIKTRENPHNSRR